MLQRFALLAPLIVAAHAQAQTTIDFESLGPQPSLFIQTVPLTTQIPGVVFAGPSAVDGGAVVHQSGNFGVPARSGVNVLGFSTGALMSNGGMPRDPEQIYFAQPVSSVSIWAAGGWNQDTITMRAFNSANAPIGLDQIYSQGWAKLSIAAPGIARVELMSAGDGAWACDDLTFDVGQPTSYCTAGTTTNGCVPAITGTGTASGSAGSGFTIAVTSVEGQRTGVLLYGIDNSGFVPLAWGQSSSFLCVKAPLQLTLPQRTGGNLNQCDGQLTIDWNAFVANTPGALGVPFSAGQQAYAQAWFRDPPSPETTMLSDALQFAVQ